jgi:cytochrome P450
VTDLKALTCILSRTSVYQKSDALRVTIRRYTGDGVLITEGDIHRAQRKLMNPAFGPGQIRNLTGIFLDKANEVGPILD